MNDNLLIESYRDFTFIFDKNTNVYFVSNCPNSDETADNCLDLSNFVEKENLEDVIDTVDSFYEDINTDVDDNSDNTDYIFIIKLKTIDGKFETVEFDDINNAQRYIDTLKIEGSHNYTEAYFLDEDGNELDSWIIADSDTNTEIKYDADESLTEDADTIISDDSDCNQLLESGWKSITVNEGLCNSLTSNLILSDNPWLESIDIKKNSLKNLNSLVIINNTQLSSIVTEDGQGYPDYPGVGYYVKSVELSSIF